MYLLLSSHGFFSMQMSLPHISCYLTVCLSVIPVLLILHGVFAVALSIRWTEYGISDLFRTTFAHDLSVAQGKTVVCTPHR